MLLLVLALMLLLNFSVQPAVDADNDAPIDVVIDDPLWGWP